MENKFRAGDMVWLIKYYQSQHQFNVTERKEIMRVDRSVLHIKNEKAFNIRLAFFDYSEACNKCNLINIELNKSF